MINICTNDNIACAIATNSKCVLVFGTAICYRSFISYNYNGMIENIYIHWVLDYNQMLPVKTIDIVYMEYIGLIHASTMEYFT